jgi:hypothetical protein
MSDYRLTNGSVVIRNSDGASIPNDPLNAAFQVYQAWLGAGGVPDPYVPPAPLPQSVLSQDLMAQFSVADYTAIMTAVSANPALGLLWASLQAQRDPMIVTNARFQAGWSALITVLGAARMSAIATALGVTISA